MSTWKTRQLLLLALFLMAISGLVLHFRIHPFMVPDPADPARQVFRGSFVTATLLPFLDVILVTLLFAFRRTAVYAYLLNGLIVILGTVLMSHFAIATLAPQSAPLSAWLLKSTLPDIGLAWADFLVGKTLYNTWMREG